MKRPHTTTDRNLLPPTMDCPLWRPQEDPANSKGRERWRRSGQVELLLRAVTMQQIPTTPQAIRASATPIQPALVSISPQVNQPARLDPTQQLLTAQPAIRVSTIPIPPLRVSISPPVSQPARLDPTQQLPTAQPAIQASTTLIQAVAAPVRPPPAIRILRASLLRAGCSTERPQANIIRLRRRRTMDRRAGHLQELEVLTHHRRRQRVRSLREVDTLKKNQKSIANGNAVHFVVAVG